MFEVSWRMDLSMKKSRYYSYYSYDSCYSYYSFYSYDSYDSYLSRFFLFGSFGQDFFLSGFSVWIIAVRIFSVWIFSVWILLVRIFSVKILNVLILWSGFCLLASDTKRCQGKAKLQRRRQGLRRTPVARCLA